MLFEISGKLGLPDSIIDYARGLLERKDIAFEDVIASIEKDRKAAEEERDEAIFLNLEIKRQKEELDLEKQRFAEKKDKILARAKEEAREMIGEAKEFADQIKKDLQELETVYDSSQRNRMQSLCGKRSKKERQEKYRDRISVPKNFDPVCASELELGDRVKVVTLDQKGEVISLPDEKIQVQVGLMKINVNLRDVSKIQGSKPRNNKGKSKFGNLIRVK